MEGDIQGPSNASYNKAAGNYDTLSGQNVTALSGYAPQVAGQANDLTEQFLTNPYKQQAQTGANDAAAYGTGTVVPMMKDAATDLSGIAKLNTGYIPQILATGFDPQNALRNREEGTMLDRQNAINAMNGVAGTPYAAGVTGDASRNFGLEWLDRQLGRQATAAGTAANLTGAAENAYTNAGAIAGGAAQGEAAYGGLPAATYADQITEALKALSGQNTVTGGATGIVDSELAQILQYLGYGTDASRAKSEEESAAWGGLGKLAGSLALAPVTGGGSLVGNFL